MTDRTVIFLAIHGKKDAGQAPCFPHYTTPLEGIPIICLTALFFRRILLLYVKNGSSLLHARFSPEGHHSRPHIPRYKPPGCARRAVVLSVTADLRMHSLQFWFGYACLPGRGHIQGTNSRRNKTFPLCVGYHLKKYPSVLVSRRFFRLYHRSDPRCEIWRIFIRYNFLIQPVSPSETAEQNSP